MKLLWACPCLGMGALGHSVTPSPAFRSLGVTTTHCLTLLITQIYSPDLPSMLLICFSMILLAHTINSQPQAFLQKHGCLLQILTLHVPLPQHAGREHFPSFFEGSLRSCD